MRLFTAIDLPGAVLDNVTRLISQFRPTARIKWSSPENLHLTTKFIGDWPEERLGELVSALRGLPSRDPIGIEIRGLGFFPNAQSPRVFWAGVHAAPGLAELARDTDRAAVALGIAPENRPFSPHLTLARVKDPVPMNALRQAIASLPSSDFGSFTASAFHLYHSRLTPSGSVYTKLSEFTFG